MTDPHDPSTPSEDNLSQLLKRSHRPPRMDREARQRILATLEAAHAAPSDQDAAPSPQEDGEDDGQDDGGAAGTTEGRVEQPKPSLRPRKSSGWWRYLLAAIVVLAFGVYFNHATQLEPRRHVNDGPPRRVVLTDGSIAVLDRGAELLEASPRQLELVKGRVYLETARGAEVTVQTPQGKAIATGARLLLAHDETTTAIVARGQALLESAAGQAVVAQGQQAVIAAAVAPRPEPSQRVSYLTEWARPALDLRETPEPLRRGTLVARQPRNPEAGEVPLELRELTVDVVVEDGVVRTTIDQTFFNQTPLQLEGVYRFPLPPDAAISRLAMYVDGKRMEAGIVEKDRGRDVYESIVFQRRDPALLEQTAGNSFKLRIFPLFARQERRLFLSYTQLLEPLYDRQRLHVPIPEIDTPVGSVNYRVRVVDGADYTIDSAHDMRRERDGDDVVLSFAAERHDIGDDLLVTLTRPAEQRLASFVVDDDRYVMARVPITLDRPAPTQRDWVLLLDTSASRSSADQQDAARFANAFVGALDDRDRLAVVAFDDAPRSFVDSLEAVTTLESNGLASWIRRQDESLGWTDLAQALASAARVLKDSDAPHILYVGDGLATADDNDLDALKRALPKGSTFVAAAVGDEVDMDKLRGLADASGGRTIRVPHGDDVAWHAFDLAASMSVARLTEVSARIGETDAYLTSSQVAEGETIIALARVPRDSREPLELTGRLGDEDWNLRVDLPEADGDASYLPRLWARRRIAALSRAADENQQEIVDLGLANFLVTPHTSLLVLENDAMYEQFDVARAPKVGWARYAAPDAIDVVHEPLQGGRLHVPAGSLIFRDRMQLWHAGSLYGTATGEGYGFGGLGLRGTGMGGGGRIGLGTIGTIGAGSVATNRVRMGGVRPRVPRVRMGWSGEGKSADVSAEDEMREIPDVVSTRLLRAQLKVPATGASLRRQYATLIEANEPAAAFMVPLEPLALQSAYDRRLDDLTEMVPALLTDAVDDERMRLLARLIHAEEGTVGPDAETLLRGLERRTGRFHSDRETVSLAADGRIAVERTRGLVERRVYADGWLTTFYPQLELVVRKPVDPAGAALRAELAPFSAPTRDEITAGYDAVMRSGNLVLKPRGSDSSDDERVLTIRDGRLHEVRSAGATLSVSDVDGALVVHGSVERRYQVEPLAERAFDLSVPAGWVAIEVPTRDPSHWETAAAAETPGSDAWLAIQRQWLVAAAALDQQDTALARIDAITEHGELTRADLVLASAALSQLGPGELKQRLGNEADPIARLLLTTTTFYSRGDVGAFAKLVDEPGLVGILASYRVAINDRYADDTLARYQRLVDRGAAPSLRYIALAGIPPWYHNHDEELAKAWTALADDADELTLPALLKGVEVAQQTGAPDVAVEHYQRILSRAERDGVFPLLHPQARQAFEASREGGAGWWRFWTRWRESALKSERSSAWVTLLRSAMSLDLDRERVREALQSREIRDPRAAEELARLLTDLGHEEDARAVLEPHLATPRQASIALLGADFAERDGQLDAADALLAKALAFADGRDIDWLRAIQERRIELAARREDPIRTMLAVADEWRRDDPDNPLIDRLSARAVWTSSPRDGWRLLTSIIDRNPGDSLAYAAVAEELERLGDLERAQVMWQRAAKTEPTNPTWLLRRAQALFSLERNFEATALVEQIAKGSWQDRFADVRARAEQLRPKPAAAPVDEDER